jgi:hypothetical protein
MLRQTTYLIIIVLLSFSCRKEIDIDIPNNERKIVLNALFFTDSVFSVNIFKSNHVQDQKQTLLYLNNAKVDVFENGNLLETLLLDTAGHYKGNNNIAIEGHKYEVVVDVPNLKQAKSKTQIPNKVPIISIDSLGISDYDNEHDETITNGDVFVNYQVKFKDSPNEKNYYRLKINPPIVYDTIYDYDDSTKYNIDRHPAFINVQTEDASIEINNEYDGYFYFSDLLFDGKEYNFNISIMHDFTTEEHFNDGSVQFIKKSYKDDITISLEHISYELFTYMKSVSMQSETQGIEMFFQAVPVYLNIENGFGILGATNVSKQKLP